MRLSRLALPLLLAFFLLPCLFASLPLPPQNPPSDAAEISRDLLFLAPTSAGVYDNGAAHMPRFYAGRLAYDFSFVSGWSINPHAGPVSKFEVAHKGKRIVSLGGTEYTLLPFSDDDRATLSLYRSGEDDPFVTAVLWTRDLLAAPWLPVLQRSKRGLTAASLQQSLEVADPVIYAVEPQGDSLWVALGHSTGEGELGLGTIVRFDVKDKQARVFRPAELATCAVTALSVLTPDSLFFGTRRQYEAVIQPCAGLVQFHPAAQQLEKITAPASLFQNSIITVLEGPWVATDKGICDLTAAASPNCWRIVPSVSLKASVTVFNKPGEKSGSELKPGDYEVLWANQTFLEIATKDSYDAWLAADDYAEAAARNFDTEPWKLLNTSTGISPIRPLTKPGGEPLEGTLVFRAPLEKLATSQGAPAGWVKVRIHAGWIERGTLEVVPRLIPLEK
jgi:hypothetical protein